MLIYRKDVALSIVLFNVWLYFPQNVQRARKYFTLPRMLLLRFGTGAKKRRFTCMGRGAENNETRKEHDVGIHFVMRWRALGTSAFPEVRNKKMSTCS